MVRLGMSVDLLTYQPRRSASNPRQLAATNLRWSILPQESSTKYGSMSYSYRINPERLEPQLGHSVIESRPTCLSQAYRQSGQLSATQDVLSTSTSESSEKKPRAHHLQNAGFPAWYSDVCDLQKKLTFDPPEPEFRWRLRRRGWRFTAARSAPWLVCRVQSA
ncbi:hypothetical protein RRG08_046705 [Elysia crispata]|uniref:Uncharacterized protein n=1 Tax=Elysia crispata TaxID=231223 RepID=A0AAE1DVL0_9GAST|nr:hypothetical protein RRG08_046705 [Elysia crispata]